MLSLIVASVFIVLAAGVAGDCPQRWHAYGTKCYFASHDAEDWPGALTLCRFLGGELAEIETEEEKMFLVNLTRHNKDHSKSGFWIGLTDIEKEGTYVWVQDKTVLTNGTGVVASWGHGQPDNSHHDQNCVFLNGNDAGNWYDGHCSSARNYMCEKQASMTGGEIVG